MLGLGLGIPLGSAIVSKSPISIGSSLALWLQNSAGVAVGQWDDSSGNSNHATQGTSGNQAVVADGGLNFDGSNDHYDLTSTITVANDSAFCLAIVLNQDTASNNTILSKTANEVISIKDAQTIEFKTNGNGNVTTELVVPNGTFTATQKLLVVLNRDRNGAFSIFQNGTAVTIDGDNSTNAAEGDNQGGFTLDVLGSNAGSSNFFDGKILGLSFWNGELSTQDIADVNSYFTGIHGI
jgi:hypothetical protein